MNASLARIQPTIVIIDDDDAVRHALSLMLRTAGYTVSAYAGGTDLLADPLPANGEVLLVDYVMPDIDGLALVARLRARGWQGRAILITGRYDISLPARAAAVGITSILEKPLGKVELLRAIATRSEKSS